MAIWPLPYFDEKWCESNIFGQAFLQISLCHSFFTASNYPQTNVHNIYETEFF